MLVGMKSDLNETRKVKFDEALKYAQEQDISKIDFLLARFLL